MPLTRKQFDLALLGRWDWLEDAGEVAAMVATLLEQRARERRLEGRPDVAGRLSWAEGRLRTRSLLTKRVRDRLRKDFEMIRTTLP